MKYIYWVVKDDEGILRPLAGMWKDNESGEAEAKRYASKEGVEVVKIELIEI